LKLEEKLSRQYLETLGIDENTLLKNCHEEQIDMNTFENSLIFTPDLGMVTEQSNWSDSKTSNQSLGTEEFKNSINGTYRIIYHRTQKQLRRKNNNFIPLAIKPNPLILKQSSSTTITKVSPLANPSPAPERISGYQPRLSFNREVSDPIKLPPLNPVSVSNRSKLKTDVKDEASRTKPRSIEQRAVTDTDASGANINLKRINVRSKSIHKSNQQVSKTCSII
jgi:hypothetical protein